MRFGVLGPLELQGEHGPVVVGARQRQVLLAVLLCQANWPVAIDALVEAVWGQAPPRTARKNLQVHMYHLRRLLGDETRIRRTPNGYLLRVAPGELDAAQFEELAEQGGRMLDAGDAHTAAALLRRSLGLWRGQAFDGLDTVGVLAEESRCLAERRLAVVERRVDADLATGRHVGLVAELRGLVAEHPLRERFRAQLMLALYRAGRQADALEVYRDTRAALIGELGVEPGPELRRLQQSILRADPALEPLPAAGPAPQASSAGVPAQLPQDVAAFTGRIADLAQLDALLPGDQPEQATAVVISAIGGTPGVGKTALAVHWAHRIRGWFPDGQLYINLRGYASTPPLRPIEALAQFLRALGIPAQRVPVELEEAAGMYRSLLAGRRLLVLLDDANSAEQVRPLLPGGPGCLVLVTSRDRLDGLVARDGAHGITLGVLTPADAVTLLGRIVGQSRVAAEPHAAAALAEVCACLPLALRIAAASLAGRPRQTIAGYLAELRAGDRLASLAVYGDEQTGVAGAFDMSYGPLAPDSQRLFRLLGLLPGADVTVDAAGTLAAQEDSEQACAAATRRLLGWYLETANVAVRRLYPHLLRLPVSPAENNRPPAAWFEGPTDALAWLEAERANLVAAIRHAADHGPRPLAWLLADTLHGYLLQRRYGADWLAVAHAAVTAARAEGDLRGQAAAQLSLSDAYHCLGSYPQSIERYSAALALGREPGWVEAQASTLGNLGFVYQDMGELEQAAECHLKALTLNRQADRQEAQGANLCNLGLVAWELGRLEEAADHYSRALAVARAVGTRIGEATILGHLGQVHHDLGQPDCAAEQLAGALRLNRELGGRYGEANNLNTLAMLHRDAGELAQARELAQAAVALARETGDRSVEANTLNTLATIHLRLADPQGASERHQQALRLARDIGTRRAETDALIGLAAVHQHLGHHDQAIGCAQQALTIARQAGFRVLEGHARMALASVCLAQGHHDQAIGHARWALDLHCRTGHRLGHARALLLLGEAVGRTKGTDAALPYWQDALALFSAIGVPEADQVSSLLERAGAPGHTTPSGSTPRTCGARKS
jgi:DNA-binding SARP family transcriptional activator/tetratricopeptide (TPR) repeat protein